MPIDEPPTPAAKRQRRYRLRQRKNVGVVPAEVGHALIEMMIAVGALSEKGALDPLEVGRAIVEMATQRLLQLNFEAEKRKKKP